MSRHSAVDVLQWLDLALPAERADLCLVGKSGRSQQLATQSFDRVVHSLSPRAAAPRARLERMFVTTTNYMSRSEGRELPCHRRRAPSPVGGALFPSRGRPRGDG